ncbi:MAG TPA: tetratricopeptide repeat protein [Anaerolineae bacterium]|nr:tetratricopeptide repeat protein [Anaerolineae bacterium]
MSSKKNKIKYKKSSYHNQKLIIKNVPIKKHSFDIDTEIKKAFQYHQSGQFEKAQEIYKEILEINPNHSDSLHLSGIIAHQSGKNDIAANLINRAIQTRPEEPVYYLSLVNVFKAQGRLDEAILSYQKALQLKPDDVEAHNNLGNALIKQGQLEEAAASYRKALTIKPDFAEAHNNLGNAFKEQGQLEEAVASYRKALIIKPDYAEAHNNLGNALIKQGRLEEAAASYRKALIIKPDYAEAHNNLGIALIKQGRLEEAAASYRKAIIIKPDYAEAHSNLGNALKEQERLEEAAASYRNALTIKPDFAEAHNNLGNALIEQGRLEEAAASYRKALIIKPDYAEAHNNLGNALIERGQLEEATASYRKALIIKPDYAEAHSNLLRNLNYFPNISGEDIYNESIKWDQQHAKTLLRKEPVYANIKEKERKLRIGYVSPDFRTHSVAYFFEPLIKAHNKENVEVYCYSNVMKPDNVTERLKVEADNWFSIVGKSDEDVAEQIRRDGIDILVDLAGHTAKNRLLVFAYKPAPIQVTWLGYGSTTGMSAIDYRFTDEVADPVGEADNLHSEELIRLESGFLCYKGDESAPEISRLPCLERGYITFGNFNNLTKTTPEVVKFWSDILHALPNAHFLMKSRQLKDEEVKAKYQGMFEKEGISGDRIELFGWLPNKKDHLGLYSKIDIGLDPFPYNGTTTTCEALWMGVPVVTMLGDRHFGRVGASILKHVGLGELIANDPKSYVEIALQLSMDIEKLAALRNGLRDQMINSPLCDASAFARNVEEAYIRMWERYVAVCEDRGSIV